MICNNCNSINNPSASFCKKCGAKLSESTSSEDIEKVAKGTGYALASIFDFVKNLLNQVFTFLKSNPKIAYLILGFFIIISSLYLIFLKQWPKYDAKSLAKDYCTCYKSQLKYENEENSKFLNTFKTIKFKNRAEAKELLADHQYSIQKQLQTCLKKIENLKAKYYLEYDYKMKLKFTESFAKNTMECNTVKNEEGIKWNADIIKKINQIQDPEPTKYEVKTALVGKWIRSNWKINNIGEIIYLEMSKSYTSEELLQYHVKCYFNSRDIQLTPIAKIVVSFNRTYNGWEYKELIFQEMEINYLIDNNKNTVINLLKNTNYSIDCNSKLLWQTGGWFGNKKVITGPNEGNKTLPSVSSIYVKSLGDRPADLKITYKPLQ